MTTVLIALIVLTVVNMIMCVPSGQEFIGRLVLIPIVLLEKFSYWIRPQIGGVFLKTEDDIQYLPSNVTILGDFPKETNLYQIDTRRRVWRWQDAL